jgi:hypothetical protein
MLQSYFDLSYSFDQVLSLQRLSILPHQEMNHAMLKAAPPNHIRTLHVKLHLQSLTLKIKITLPPPNS